MDALQAFLQADLDTKKEVFIDRLGVSLVIKPLDGKQVQQITEQATFGKGNMDEFMFSAIAIVKSCENLDFGNAEMLKKYEVSTAYECVQKALYAGEIALVQKEIMSISGFKDMSAQVKSAKN